MRRRWSFGNHGAVTATSAPPRLERVPGQGPLLGVAAAIADHLGVPARWVRLAFIALVPAAGLGLVLYGAYFIVLPTADPSDRPRSARLLEGTLAVVIALVSVGIAGSALPRGNVLVPVMLAVLGGALIWRQASEPERTRLRTLSLRSMTSGEGIGRARLVLGAALVVSGGALVLARADVTAVRDGLLAVIVTLVGVALITGPWWMRLVTQLSAEREERVRSQARADIAAHLHDSVLQTLALIQRNADSPREVSRLARGQERELRHLLYESQQASGQFGELLRTSAAEIEDAYAISVEVVLVGEDAEVDEGLAATGAAAREALVNAAKHAGIESVSLFAEIEDEVVSVFVKDRGAGFVVDEVADDRQGVKGSIVARVERHGGTAAIRSAPGRGTEVELRMPRREVRE